MGRLIIALVRHGEYRQRPATPSAHQPYPLTERGRADARRSAQLIAATAVQHGCRIAQPIDCSQMLRAWQTAEVIAGQLSGDHRVESFDALAERGLGSAANLTVAQIEAVLAADPRYPEPPAAWKSDSDYRLPLQGAESLLMAGERVAEHLRWRAAQLADADADRMKLVVGHGAAFRHAAYHLGVLAFEQIARLSMYHDQPVFIENLPDSGSWRQVAGAWKQRDAGSSPLD